ncbi:uncharacterized protein [Chironomus tepperi]|uniref:uncharacterized protein n=1 Tax=Chironomus tepperi TaxID=113505 RepID=UPI00391F29A9
MNDENIAEHHSPNNMNNNDAISNETINQDVFDEFPHPDESNQNGGLNKICTSQPTESGYKYAVITSSYPESSLSKENVTKLLKLLRDNFYEHLELNRQETEKALCFSKFGSKAGALIFHCDNHYTVEWLKTQASSISILIDGFNVPLKVVPFKDIKRYKLTTIIYDQKVKNEEILRRFELQNCNEKLKTCSWEILEKRNHVDEKLFLCIEVDHLSYNIIIKNNYKLHYDFEKVTFNNI